MDANDVEEQGKKVSFLKVLGGIGLQQVIGTLTAGNEEDEADQEGNTKELFDSIIEKLDKHFMRKRNTVLERFKFRNMVQGEKESLDRFCTRLRIAAKYCGLHDVDEEIDLN